MLGTPPISHRHTHGYILKSNNRKLEDQKMYSYLGLIKHRVIQMYMSGGIVLHILNLGIRWRWMIKLKPCPLECWQQASITYRTGRLVGLIVLVNSNISCPAWKWTVIAWLVTSRWTEWANLDTQTFPISAADSFWQLWNSSPVQRQPLHLNMF